MNRKKALITGISGQDGSYLAELLISKGYKVFGVVRKTSSQNHPNLDHIQSKLNLIYGDLIDQSLLNNVITQVKPDEVYNLAAQSSPADSFKQQFHTAEITGIGAHRLFESVRQFAPKAKVYQASSSEMFGWVKEIPQDENTPFNPANPYAAAKLYAHTMAKIYRESYNMFISCGILFNHESARRGMGFVTQKVTYAAACAKLGIRTSHLLNEVGSPILKDNRLALGNLDAKRDWGSAEDFVQAMWLILQQKRPDDFVVATSDTHTIRELCQEAFSYIGLNWKNYVYVDKRLVRPTETGPLIGDYKKIRKVIGWKPKTRFKGLIAQMVDAHLNALTQKK